jgi:hypothetical protein
MLDRAYNIGRQRAIAEFEKLSSSEMEKEAFLSALKGIYQGSKALKSLGWLAGFGGRSSQWIGMPLGSGLLGAAMAEDGQGMKGFVSGVAGGLVGSGIGAVANKALPSIARSIGKTDFGKRIWASAGKVNPNYGVNSLKAHKANVSKMRAEHLCDASKAGEKFKPPPPPKVNKAHSFGQHALTKLPGAIGTAGMIGGFMYGTPLGEEVGSSLYESSGLRPLNLGSFSQKSIFNPAG